MIDATSLIGVVITAIVIVTTVGIGIIYYLIVYRYAKPKAPTTSKTTIALTTGEQNISTTSF